MKGICVRCGFTKPDHAAVCPDCGHRPDGEGLLVAWLLSAHNLDEVGLAATAARIRAGEPIRPSRRMLRKARRALGRQIATDPGLTLGELVGVLLADVVFTSLVGWTCVAWWWDRRPRAALQAGLVTLPTTVVGFGFWGWMAFGGAS